MGDKYMYKYPKRDANWVSDTDKSVTSLRTKFPRPSKEGRRMLSSRSTRPLCPIMKLPQVSMCQVIYTLVLKYLFRDSFNAYIKPRNRDRTCQKVGGRYLY